MNLEPGHNLSLEDLDKQSLAHGYTPLAQHMEKGPHIISRGQGVRITDTKGKEFIDGVAGLWCVNVGWGRREIVDAVAKQLEDLSYYHTFVSTSNEPAIRLADRILRIAPPNMSKVFFNNSGSEANDTNAKIVWYYNNLRGKPEKKKIISRKFGYHGVTIGAASLTGLPLVHQAFDLPLERILHTEKPHYYWLAEPGMSEEDYARQLAQKLDELIMAEGPDTVGAFIAEPVMGAGGVVVPPKGYFEEIQKVLKKHDVLFIVDEVICGFGRLGKMFGSYVFDLEPDLMSMAKGLTSGYVPMSASVISEKVWNVLLEGTEKIGAFAHGFTYSAHPAAAAAGLASLDIIENENLVENAAKVGGYFQHRLHETFDDHPLVGEVRGIGLMAGVELVEDKKNKVAFDLSHKIGPRLGALCLEEGVILRALFQSTAIGFSPPLVVTESDIDQIVDGFGRALDRLRDQLVSEGLWRG